jgi:tetratricopeptide (TPR) repeat protein
MAPELIERSPIKQLVKNCTVKLWSAPNGNFLGTGFFVAPDQLATCRHVFFKNGNAVTGQFRIGGYEGEFKLADNHLQHEGLDLLVVQLDAPIAKQCINLEATTSQEGDRLWGWSYNTSYPEGSGLVPVLQTDAKHNGWEVYRVSRDIVKQGSSGTPILNVESGKLLGITYWVKDSDALIIPAIYFKAHFQDLYQENQTHHQKTGYWEEALRQSRSHQVKRLTLIPPIDNEDVIGRAADLENLRQQLQSTNKVLLMNGVGGIGKTTLAKLYINNYAEEYDRLIWIEQKKGLVEDIAANALLQKSLSVEQAGGLDAEDLFNQVMLTLQNYNQGMNLLVVDNATQSLHDIKDRLPHGKHWHVLLTSRELISASFELIRLGRLSQQAARSLFLKHCNKPQEEKALADFLEQLERHTLSIELFAKILDGHWKLQTVNELAEYLNHKQIDEETLQTIVEIEHAKGSTKLYRHLLGAFDLSGLGEKPELLITLQRMAALPPAIDGYPAKDLLEWFGMEEKATQFVNGLQELFKMGWLTQPKNNHFGLHRLISMIISKAHPAEPKQLKPILETFINKLAIDQTKDNPIDKFQWAPFGQTLLDTLAGAELERTSTLQNNLALVLQALGDYQGARELLEKALRLHERHFGEEHPNTAVSYSNLAMVLKDLGDYQGARELLEKALRSNERHFGEEHPTTALSYSNLAMVLKALGDYQGARELLEKAMRSYERHFGEEHPTTAGSYSNLATVLQALGDYQGARELLEKALRSNERHFGEEHPTTAVRYSNLATVLQDLGDYQGARDLFEKALRVFRYSLGKNHPNTKVVISWLKKLDQLEEGQGED